MILPHSITHLPATKATSATGGMKMTWATGSTYRAFCQWRSDTLDVINQAGVSNTGLVAYVEPTITPTAGDRIKFQGDLFEIFGVKKHYNARGMLHHVELRLSNIDNAA